MSTMYAQLGSLLLLAGCAPDLRAPTCDATSDGSHDHASAVDVRDPVVDAAAPFDVAADRGVFDAATREVSVALDATMADRDIPAVPRDVLNVVDGSGCTQVGDLRCSSTLEVLECIALGDGRLAATPRTTCATPSFGLCNPVDARERADAGPLAACGNACGGRGCMLAHRPGSAVDGLSCATWECLGLCDVRPSRCACHEVSARCAADCECASGRCDRSVCVPR